jgi:hypothetical protein
MTVDVQFDASDVNIRLDQVNDQIIKNVKREIGLIGLMIKSRAQRNLLENGSIDTGGLWGSVDIDVSKDGMEVRVGTPLKLGAWVEFGGASTPENAGKPHPVSKEGRIQIAEWAQRKLGASEEDAKTIANAIAWKIQKYGQRPKPWLFPAFESEKPNIQMRIENAIIEGLK